MSVGPFVVAVPTEDPELLFYDAMVPGTYEAYVGEGKLIDPDLYAQVKEIGEQFGGDPGTWRP